jgi:hypothetical protein
MGFRIAAKACYRRILSDTPEYRKLCNLVDIVETNAKPFSAKTIFMRGIASKDERVLLQPVFEKIRPEDLRNIVRGLSNDINNRCGAKVIFTRLNSRWIL